MVQAVQKRWGGIDLWAHCAVHAAPLSPAAQTDPKEIARSIDTNISATHGLMQLVEPFHFNFNELGLWRRAGRLCQHGRHATGCGNVVFFDEDSVVQAHAVVGAAADPHRVFLRHTQARQTGPPRGGSDGVASLQAARQQQLQHHRAAVGL